MRVLKIYFRKLPFLNPISVIITVFRIFDLIFSSNFQIQNLLAVMQRSVRGVIRIVDIKVPEPETSLQTFRIIWILAAKWTTVLPLLVLGVISARPW